MKSQRIATHFILFPILSALLFWLAWPPKPVVPFIFIAFVPILLNQHFIRLKFEHRISFKLWLADYCALFLINAATTWWVCNSSFIGGIFAVLLNAGLMTIPFLAYRFTKKYTNAFISSVAFISYWVMFEFVHLRWELTWPWLTLGNAFAKNHTWIQWYEYTGVFGGTIWILILNMMFFHIAKQIIWNHKTIKNNKRGISIYFQLSTCILLMILPIILSKKIYTIQEDVGIPFQVTAVQPNFNPFTEKFTIPYDQQLNKMLTMAKNNISDSTDFLIFPETAIPHPIWMDQIRYAKPIRMMRNITDSFPNLSTIIGINAYEKYVFDKTATAREIITQPINKNKPDTIWVDAFNTAILVDTSKQIQVYHKSKLVPGVERMPYPAFFGFLEKFAIDLGGISGSLATQKERIPLCSKNNICVATTICYESVFGEYVSEYILNGANVIFIITNDGWWGNTDGHIQHYLYAKLRAIETRKSIARSANTGTSCFINQRGDVSMQTEWEKDAVIEQTIYANEIKTFYTIHGDYLARIFMLIGGILFVYTCIKRISIKKREKK